MCLATLASCGTSGASKSISATAAYTLQTPPLPVEAGQERYVCYAKTLDEDLVVDRFDYADKPNVHHLFLSRALKPEPEGVSECDVLFRTSWVPLFVAGKGNAMLEYPPGAASVLPKGTQIVLQLHLLNAGATAATVGVDIEMRRSTVRNAAPVGLYAFGTQRISLPANATTSVSYECAPEKDVQSFTMLVHMHRLGTRLTFETADASGVYHEVFRRDPYNFDNQFLDSTPLYVPKGTKTRITCTYSNTTGTEVTYGESTNEEMCFLATFVQGQSGPLGCIDTVDKGDAGSKVDAGACSSPTPNALGIGLPCSKGGGECVTGLQCSADVSPSPDSSGFCLKVGCATSSDCGQGATCCAPAQAGGAVQVCLPSACVPADCAVK